MIDRLYVQMCVFAAIRWNKTSANRSGTKRLSTSVEAAVWRNRPAIERSPTTTTTHIAEGCELCTQRSATKVRSSVLAPTVRPVCPLHGTLGRFGSID
uniref:Secreted protein n=1 Tax=Plectus sambesii TaxID=2011161 RepID=A0A914VIX3_9BILA